MQAPNSSLTVHRPVLSSTRITYRFTIDGAGFENSYDFPTPLGADVLSDPIMIKLCELSAITTGFGLFSIDYITHIDCEFPLAQAEIDFFEKLIFLGFGEFRYVNTISITTRTSVTGSQHTVAKPLYSDRPLNGALLLNGGGKDGSVSAWLLEHSDIDFTWFQRGNSAAQSGVLNQWSHPAIIITRNLDPKRKMGKYFGHRPMSAGIAFIALITAYAYGYRDVIASNETSANEGNDVIDGFTLNHQYSKSFEFEQDLQDILDGIGVKLRYFSLLRPLHELQIGAIATKLNNQQLGSIISCNQGTREGIWCLNCAKCAFVVLIFTAINPAVAATIWSDEAIINRSALHPFLRTLIDPDIAKPLECVGTLEECQIAAGMILRANSEKPLLSTATQTLLEPYAITDIAATDAFLQSYADASIPPEYNTAVNLMQKTLLDLSS